MLAGPAIILPVYGSFWKESEPAGLKYIPGHELSATSLHLHLGNSSLCSLWHHILPP